MIGLRASICGDLRIWCCATTSKMMVLRLGSVVAAAVVGAAVGAGVGGGVGAGVGTGVGAGVGRGVGALVAVQKPIPEYGCHFPSGQREHTSGAGVGAGVGLSPGCGDIGRSPPASPPSLSGTPVLRNLPAAQGSQLPLPVPAPSPHP